MKLRGGLFLLLLTACAGTTLADGGDDHPTTTLKPDHTTTTKPDHDTTTTKPDHGTTTTAKETTTTAKATTTTSSSSSSSSTSTPPTPSLFAVPVVPACPPSGPALSITFGNRPDLNGQTGTLSFSTGGSVPLIFQSNTTVTIPWPAGAGDIALLIYTVAAETATAGPLSFPEGCEAVTTTTGAPTSTSTTTTTPATTTTPPTTTSSTSSTSTTSSSTTTVRGSAHRQ